MKTNDCPIYPPFTSFCKKNSRQEISLESCQVVYTCLICIVRSFGCHRSLFKPDAVLTEELPRSADQSQLLIVQTNDAKFRVDRLRLILRMSIPIHSHGLCAPAYFRVLNICGCGVDRLDDPAFQFFRASHHINECPLTLTRLIGVAFVGVMSCFANPTLKCCASAVD